MNMKKSHAGAWMGFAVFFAAALYSAILFLLKRDFDLSAWVLYGATIIAFLLLGISAAACARSGSGSIVTDTAMGIVSLVFFGVQLLLGGIALMCFSGLPTVPVVVGEALLLAAWLLYAFRVSAAQSHAAAQDRSDSGAVGKLRAWESDLKGAAERSGDPGVKQALDALAEEIHYSHVSSSPRLDEIDGRISALVAILRDEPCEDREAALARIEKLGRLVRERDRLAPIVRND